MHRAKPGSGAKETNNVDTKITLDQRPRHVSRHSESDPEADIAPQGVSPANFYQSLQQMPCWIGGHGTVP